ncbi:MAG: HD domain-containing protein [Desulfopila sp.]|jgi:poly(A) polymerase|nr:HD domain-containing protein [Desulfopila sp.]
MSSATPSYPSSSPLAVFPAELHTALLRLEKEQGVTIYVSGGTIRDWLLGRRPADLDLCVEEHARQCCRRLVRILEGGAYVPLGTAEEEAARVVWRGISVDVSSFRKGAKTIAEELHHRDFTINAMAVSLHDALRATEICLVDPLGGRSDLIRKLLRCCPAAFSADPLRMLRGYRFQTELGFVMDSSCVAAIQKQRSTLGRCAAERVLHELEHIMVRKGAGGICLEMAESGLLWEIFPELEKGVGLEQPGYHHEDVFHHSILALQCLDQVIAGVQDYFGEYAGVILTYCKDKKKCSQLRWAALFHDLGKPTTASSGTMTGGRTTFYNHDQVGKKLFSEIAGRLRMSRQDTLGISALIEMHMHPFHLSNVRREKPLSRKALLKICKRAGDMLPGLFLLAMADSLAGQGERKPAGMEKDLSDLFDEIEKTREENIEPVLQGKRLVTGHDLITLFHLAPGPHFKEIFDALEIAQVEAKVTSREEALSWLKRYLDTRASDTIPYLF